jgi:two-component system, NarL family, nitrate/nitrite response regulator NarL
VSVLRILVVDDFSAWRKFIRAKLQQYRGLQIVGEACDGIEALRKVQNLRPDMILLDIALPRLNGFELARQIRKQFTKIKILFVSENRSREIVEEALRIGSGGYVVKSDAETDLLPAMKAVVQRKQFVSASLLGPNIDGAR